MISILNLEPKDYSSEARSLIGSIGKIYDGPFTRDELIQEIPKFDALIVRLSHQIDKEIIDSAKCLKVISTATTGINHIDVDYAKNKGINVLSLKNETDFLNNVYATAEHTWALILSLIRKIPEAHQSVLQGDWNRDAFKGRELHGATLGIVGLGRIGKKIAKYAHTFGMKVIAHTINSTNKYEHIQIVKTLDLLLKRSDIITVHVPLESNTYKMFKREQFFKMKKGSLFINTSRGEVIDENALIEAIKQKHLRGAALDVVHEEGKLIQNGFSEVVEFAKNEENFIITPHIGGATFESMEKTEIFMAKKLINYLSKVKIKNTYGVNQ
jgi:D-3-phosphoglycerate dehydrogenase